jgi:hypothetical protein
MNYLALKLIKKILQEEIGRNKFTPKENTLPMDPEHYPEVDAWIDSIPRSSRWVVNIKSNNPNFKYDEIKEFESETDAEWYLKNKSDSVRQQIMNLTNFPTNNTKKHK